MKWLWRCIGFLWRDKRSESEQLRERAFIIAVNGLRTLHVTPEGRMSIEPEEIRERVIAGRHALKHLVQRD